jgi:flagellar biosynthetic protein FlhB
MSDTEDRTIPATPRRRELARRQGAMPTASLPAWAAAAMTAVLLLPAWWEATLPAATEMMRGAIVAAVADGAAARPQAAAWLPTGLLLPSVALIVAVGVVGLAVRLPLDGGGWRLARAAPSLQRISLRSGLARIFSASTVLTVVANAMALAVLLALAATSAGPLASVVSTPHAAIEPMRLMAPLQRLFATVAAGAAVLAACQWGLARLRFERRIRMTPQEFADESRAMQAAPQVRLMQRRR